MALDVEVLRSEIRKVYADVATDPNKGYHFHTGPDYARERLGYPQELLDRVPREVSTSFAGVGNPFSLGPIHKGEVVLDIGSGAGMDAFIAASLVGPTGRVIGLDMTDAMLEKATAWQQRLDLRQLEFRKGVAEEIPLDESSVDVVISNGVINLTPEKPRVFREVHRVLKPGGRLQIADIIVQKEIPADAKGDVAVWTAWIGGALLEGEYLEAIWSAGLVEVEIGWRGHVFAGASGERKAVKFGTEGVTIRGRRPA